MFLDRKATCIQRAWKSHKSVGTFWKLRRAVVYAQNRYRSKLAFRELCRLRREARDLPKVAAERDQLKEEMERLKKELELEKKRTEMTRQELRQEKAEEVVGMRDEIRRLNEELTIANGKRSPTKSETDNLKFLIQEVRNKEEQLESLRSELDCLRSAADSFSIQSVTVENTTMKGSSDESISLPFSAKKSSPIRSDVSLLDSLAELGHTETPTIGRAVEGLSTSIQENDDFSEHKEDETGMNTSSSNPKKLFPTSSNAALLSPPRQQKSEAFYSLHGGAVDLKREGEELRHLHNSIRQGNMVLFNRILEQSSDACVLINETDKYGRTALHLAAISANEEVASTLVSKGAFANAQDEDGETPLHLSESATIAEFLLRKGGASPNVPNIDGITALHLAVQRRDLDLVRTLLRYGADVNVQDNIRWFSALHLIALPATKRDMDENSDSDVRHRIAQLLAKSMNSPGRPDLNDQDREGNTPLHYAVQLESQDACDLVGVFLEQGADPNVCNERNQAALHLLCHNTRLRELDLFQEAIEKMLSNGADPNLQSLTAVLHFT